MKRIILILMFLLSGLLSYAQDVITTLTGSRIYCTVLEVSGGKVYYGIGRDITRYSIDQSQVKEIQYAKQIAVNPQLPQYPALQEPRQAATVGILEGGGGLVGLDWEFLVGRKVGIQLGAGIVSFGASLNMHFKPDIRSSFVSLQYWHQGVGDTYTQSLLGPSYVFRARKILSAQIGFGYVLERGPAWPTNVEPVDVMLTYAIGIYFPIKN